MKTCPNCQTRNEDEARYCRECRFALDVVPPPKPPESDAQDTVVLPPPVDPPRLALGLDPEVVGLPADGTAQVRVRVTNTGGEAVEVALRMAERGVGRSTFDPMALTVSPDETAMSMLEIGPVAPARTRVEYEVAAVALNASVPTARARGALEPEEEHTGGLVRLLPALATALLVVAAVVLAIAALDGDDRTGGGGGGGGDGGAGVSGEVRWEEGIVREGPSTSADEVTRVERGTPVVVTCRRDSPNTDGFALLADPHSGNWIAFNALRLDADLPDC